MKRQFRKILRPHAREFVRQITRNAPGYEGMVVAEAIEAIREEAEALGVGSNPRTLQPEIRDDLLRVLRKHDIVEARDNLLQMGETYFFDWLDRKLANHVPYRTMSDAVIQALTRNLTREPMINELKGKTGPHHGQTKGTQN
jgi:hypothetical protein